MGAVVWVLTMVIVFLTVIIVLLVDNDERDDRNRGSGRPSSTLEPSPCRDADRVVDHLEPEPVVRR